MARQRIKAMKLPPVELLDLGNGLKMVHIHQKDVAAGIFGFVAGAGSAHDGEHPGLAHMVEHTIFKGTKHRQAWHINNRMEAVGGELNAFTTKEETTVYSIFPSGNEARAVELLADLAIFSQFPEREFEKEREVVLDEICSYRDMPSEAIYDDFEDMVFANTPLGHNILGCPETVKALTPANCRNFLSSYYNRSNMVVFYSGPCPPARMQAVATRHFEQLPAGQINALERNDRFVLGNRCEQIENLHQAHAMIGAEIGSLHSPGRFAEKLFANIIGGPGMNSLLNIELREHRGLVYTVEAGTSHYRGAGLLNIYFGCDAHDLERCLNVTHAVMKRIAARSDSELERRLDRTKRQYLGQLAIGSENRENRVMGNARHVLYFDNLPGEDTALEAIKAVTAAQIKALAEKLIKPATLVFTP